MYKLHKNIIFFGHWCSKSQVKLLETIWEVDKKNKKNFKKNKKNKKRKRKRKKNRTIFTHNSFIHTIVASNAKATRNLVLWANETLL